MDTTIIASLIGTVGVIAAALLSRTGAFEPIFSGKRYKKLPKEWISKWIDVDDTTRTEFQENFFITKQRGSKISGYICTRMRQINDGILRATIQRVSFSFFTIRLIRLMIQSSKTAGVIFLKKRVLIIKGIQ